MTGFFTVVAGEFVAVVSEMSSFMAVPARSGLTSVVKIYQ